MFSSWEGTTMTKSKLSLLVLIFSGFLSGALCQIKISATDATNLNCLTIINGDTKITLQDWVKLLEGNATQITRFKLTCSDTSEQMLQALNNIQLIRKLPATAELSIHFEVSKSRISLKGLEYLQGSLRDIDVITSFHLDLYDASAIEKFGINLIASSVSRSKKLKSFKLFLKNCPMFDDYGMNALLTSLGSRTGLQHFGLGYEKSQLTSKGFQSLATLLTRFAHSLESLDLVFRNNFNFNGKQLFVIRQAIGKMNRLKVINLDVRQTQVTPYALKDLAKTFRGMRNCPGGYVSIPNGSKLSIQEIKNRYR